MFCVWMLFRSINQLRYYVVFSEICQKHFSSMCLTFVRIRRFFVCQWNSTEYHISGHRRKGISITDVAIFCVKGCLASKIKTQKQTDLSICGEHILFTWVVCRLCFKITLLRKQIKRERFHQIFKFWASANALDCIRSIYELYWSWVTGAGIA